MGEHASEIRSRWPGLVIAEVGAAVSNGDSGKGAGILYDASFSPDFGRQMLSMIGRRRRIKNGSSEVIAIATRESREIDGPLMGMEPHALKAEQSNTSIIFGDKLIMKLFRKLESGINPDIEIGRFLTERAHYQNTPPLVGWMEYKSGRSEPRNLAILQRFVANQGDAWEYMLKGLEHYFEQAATKPSLCEIPQGSIVDLLEKKEPDPLAAELMGTYIDAAQLIGRRVAELHLALLSDNEDPDFAPEPYGTLHQRSVYQSMRNLLGRVIRLLNGRLNTIPQELRKLARDIAAQHNAIAARFEMFLNRRVSVVRMRYHGDLHLGQMLFTGKDFVIIDFEGEPARPLSDRRHKRAALRDVAGMLRSFHYAALSQMISQLNTGGLGNVDFATMEQWVHFWEIWFSWSFLRGYVETTNNAPCLPKDREELKLLLDAFVMEKAVYELGYELDNRPEWVFLPLNGIAHALGMGPASPELSASAARGLPDHD